MDTGLWVVVALSIGWFIGYQVSRDIGVPKRLKRLNNFDLDKKSRRAKDLSVVGNANAFQLISGVSSNCEGWARSTRAMEVQGGCIVHSSTQQRNPEGDYALSESMVYIPGVKITHDARKGRILE